MPLTDGENDGFAVCEGQLRFRRLLVELDREEQEHRSRKCRPHQQLSVFRPKSIRLSAQETTLHSQLGEEYWKAAIPGDLQAKVKERVSEQNRSKIVTRIEDPMIKLQYTDIMDLHKIIEKNWKCFQDKIEDREDLKNNFLALKNYRNPLGHAREMDIVARKRGEAAIVWLRRMLSTPASHETELATSI